MEPGTQVLRALRVRYYKDHPYCYIINTLPLEIGRAIPARQWEKVSILLYLQKHHRIRLGDADVYIRATVADTTLARWLEVCIGSPLLQVNYLIRDAERHPVASPVVYYRSDLLAFTLRFSRLPEDSVGTTRWLLREGNTDQADPTLR